MFSCELHMKKFCLFSVSYIMQINEQNEKRHHMNFMENFSVMALFT